MVERLPVKEMVIGSSPIVSSNCSVGITANTSDFLSEGRGSIPLRSTLKLSGRLRAGLLTLTEAMVVRIHPG